MSADALEMKRARASATPVLTEFSYNCPASVPSELKFLFQSWWRHQMETFSALLAICAGNSPVPGEFAAQRPVPGGSFDVFFDLRLNKRLSKQSWGWWFETLLRPLWHHCNVYFSMDLNQGGVSLHLGSALNFVVSHFAGMKSASWFHGNLCVRN